MEKNGIKAGNRKEKIAYSIVAIALFLILLFFPGGPRVSENSLRCGISGRQCVRTVPG